HRHRETRSPVRNSAGGGQVAVLLHSGGDAAHVSARLEPAAWPHRARPGCDPRPARRVRGDGHPQRALQVACIRSIGHVHRRGRRHPAAFDEEESPMKTKLVCIGAMLAAFAFPAAAQKKYDPGASDTEIKIGNTNPYSGPASAYGTIGKTIDAYFRMVNDQGGINGRKVRFISYDDGYTPPKTVEMARKLVEQDQVLFLFQTLGTPSNTAIHKYMNLRKVPQL